VGEGVAAADVSVELVGSGWGWRTTSTQYELPTLMPLQSLFTDRFYPSSVRSNSCENYKLTQATKSA
jgi:hypothetical protein